MAESEVLGMSKIYNYLDEELLFTRNAELRLEIDIMRKEFKKMANTLDEAVSQIAAIQATFDSAWDGMSTAVSSLQTQVADLKAQIASGGTPDLTALSTALDTFQNDVTSKAVQTI